MAELYKKDDGWISEGDAKAAEEKYKKSVEALDAEDPWMKRPTKFHRKPAEPKQPKQEEATEKTQDEQEKQDEAAEDTKLTHEVQEYFADLDDSDSDSSHGSDTDSAPEEPPPPPPKPEPKPEKQDTRDSEYFYGPNGEILTRHCIDVAVAEIDDDLAENPESGDEKDERDKEDGENEKTREKAHLRRQKKLKQKRQLRTRPQPKTSVKKAKRAKPAVPAKKGKGKKEKKKGKEKERKTGTKPERIAERIKDQYEGHVPVRKKKTHSHDAVYAKAIPVKKTGKMAIAQLMAMLPPGKITGHMPKKARRFIKKELKSDHVNHHLTPQMRLSMGACLEWKIIDPLFADTHSRRGFEISRLKT